MRRIPVIVLMVVLLSSCVSYHGAARIESTPPGAQVVNLEDDTILGITPFNTWWRDSKQQRKFVNIRLQRDGYEDKTTSFWVTLRHNSREDALSDPHQVSIKLDKK